MLENHDVKFSDINGRKAGNVNMRNMEAFALPLQTGVKLSLLEQSEQDLDGGRGDDIGVTINIQDEPESNKKLFKLTLRDFSRLLQALQTITFAYSLRDQLSRCELPFSDRSGRSSFSLRNGVSLIEVVNKTTHHDVVSVRCGPEVCKRSADGVLLLGLTKRSAVWGEKYAVAEALAVLASTGFENYSIDVLFKLTIDVLILQARFALRNISNKLYERRKNAALEVEVAVRNYAANGDHDKIEAIIDSLILYVEGSPGSADPYSQQGGLIGLAAATVGLAGDANQHLHKIVPPVVKAFAIKGDSKVRYYACEALYNIAKVTRGDVMFFFNDIFEALSTLSADGDSIVQSAVHLLDRLIKDIVTESDQFSIQEFIPLLRRKMSALNPFMRQFLVGWITLLDSVPEIDMLGFLPDILDGLFNMLNDQSHEIRQQADEALREFLQEIKNAQSVDYGRMANILVQRAKSADQLTRLTSLEWIKEFVKLGGQQLQYAGEDESEEDKPKDGKSKEDNSILGVVLACISDKYEPIRVVAKETSEELRNVKPIAENDFDVRAVLKVAKSALESEWEGTRLEALRWILFLLKTYRIKMLSYVDDLYNALLKSLSDTSDEVVLLVLEVLAGIAGDGQRFRRLMVLIVDCFRKDPELREKRGIMVIRRLCTLLSPENVYHDLAIILEGEADLEFATIMVQALNLILLTAPELSELRALLNVSVTSTSGSNLFGALYASWCHSPIAIVSLCLLAQAYPHASSLLQSVDELDIDANLLVQADKLVRLLETPVFTYLRLQLLDPGRYPALLKTLYGLLLLLPQQTSAFKILRTRLKTIPMIATLQVQPPSGPDGFTVQSSIRRTASGGPYAQIPPHTPAIASSSQTGAGGQNIDSKTGGNSVNFDLRLQQFEHMQQQHRIYRGSWSPSSERSKRWK
ncbi:hypothetical protein R1flu_022576 [Riccia fluitans]|uniref:Vacuolar protein 14 C-terminal Fig4-binding domain-containing protein n=1 Tax=Riccia fluitans TaxID=41844 RepID=A0ABD1XPK2_9MARC